MKELVRVTLMAAAISACVAIACTPSGKPDVRTAVDIAQVLCPDFSCVEALLGDPNVTPEAKAQLRAARAARPDASK